MFLDESNDVAGFAAGPAAKILVALIDVKGGVVIVVEGTQSPVLGGSHLTEGHVPAHDVNDVVGLLDQGYPFVRQGATRVQEDEGKEAEKGLPSEALSMTSC